MIKLIRIKGGEKKVKNPLLIDVNEFFLFMKILNKSHGRLIQKKQ